ALQDGFAVRGLDFHRAENRDIALRRRSRSWRRNLRQPACCRLRKSPVGPLDFYDRMKFPRRGAPGIVILVAGDGPDGGADVFGVMVMLVIPQKVTGHSDPLRFVPGRFVGEIGTAEEGRQLLDANSITKDRVLGPRRNLANDR